MSPKVLYFFALSRILEIFTQGPLIGRNLRKRYPNVPYFYGFCHSKTPYFLPCIHMVCLRGMLLPQTRSEAGKFCILETESCNLVNTFRCKFNKGDENKISVLQAQPTQLCIMDEFHQEGRDDIQAIIPLVKHGRGYILQPPSINLHTWLSKQMPSVPEDVRAEAF